MIAILVSDAQSSRPSQLVFWGSEAGLRRNAAGCANRDQPPLMPPPRSPSSTQARAKKHIHQPESLTKATDVKEKHINNGEFTLSRKNEGSNLSRFSEGQGPSHPTVLIVDDEATQRMTARVYLEAAGFEVFEVACGEDCLPCARRERPDLIMLDVLMPGIDGFDVCRLVRADPDLKHTPILMVTALEDEDSIERAFAAGATDFLVKPMAWSLLAYRVKFTLRLSSVEQSTREALRLAETASQAKSAFLANMSHELRTPLNAIIGFSDFMRSGKLTPSSSIEYAEHIHESGAHLLQIVTDILDLSRVEAGMTELNEEIFEIASVVRAAILLVSKRAANCKIELSVSFGDALPQVRADSVRLKQILINLLSNAVKFTPPHGEIGVRVERNADGGMSVIVRDTGIGMAPEQIPQIQQPFVQLDDVLTKRYEGTGLGVPLALAMTKLHGGSLEFESRPGVGTTVTLTLPAERMITCCEFEDASV